MRISGTLVLLLSLALEALCQTKDYYKILGLEDTASIPEVKRAFRDLAKKLHPDKSKEDKASAEAKFREILEAYEVLSDEGKKREYDAAKNSHGFGSRNSHFDFGGGTRAQDFHFDFSELFKQFEDDIFNVIDKRSEDLKRHYKSHFGSHFKNHARESGGFFDMGDFLHDFDAHFEDQKNDIDDIFGDMDSMFNFEGNFGAGSGGLRNNNKGHSHKRRQQRCETVTQKIGNTVTTYTQCS